MMCYQSDGWSVMVAPRKTLVLDGLRITKTGRFRAEFMIEIGIMKRINEAGSIQSVIDARPPRPMSCGKSLWHICQASWEFWELLRLSGHRGVQLNIYVQDGLHYHGMLLRQRARHDLWYLHGCDGPDDDVRWALQQTEVVVGVECKLHIGARAVKWGSKRHTTEELLDDVRIGFKSLISCSMSLREQVRPFLIRSLTYDVELTTDWSWREKLWQCLGVDPEMMGLFEEVNPRWDADAEILYVNPALQSDDQGMHKIETLYHWAFAWNSFIFSRFAAVGKCARRWLLTVLLGLDSVYKATLKDPTVPNTHLHGYKKIQEDARTFLCVASLAYYPVETVLTAVMEDDRFYAHFPAIWDEFVGETEYVVTLPGVFFDTIIHATGIRMDGSQLFEEILIALHVANAFFYQEACREVFAEPVKHTQGDICQNVADIASLDAAPSHYVMLRIWNALRSRISTQNEMVKLFRLWRDVGTSTVLSEQGHGAGARNATMHPLLDYDSICARSLVVRTSTLLARKKDELQIEKLTAEIDDLSSRKRRRITARNKFCSAVMQDDEQMDQLGGGDCVAGRASCIKQHNALFDALSAAEKQTCFQEAIDENHARDVVDALKASQKRLSLALVETRQRAAEEREGDCNSLRGLRFNEHDIEALASHWSGANFCSDRVEREWEGFIAPPDVPAEHIQKEVLRMEEIIREREAEEPMSWWAREISRRRMYFGQSGFMFGSDPEHIYYFLYAKLRPVYLMCIKAKVVPHTWPNYGQLAPGEDGGVDELLQRYEYDHMAYVSDRDMPNGNDDLVWVVPKMTLLPKFLITFHDPEPLDEVLRRLPKPPRQPSTQNSGNSRLTISETEMHRLWNDYPWLTFEDLLAAFGRARGSTSGGATGDSDSYAAVKRLPEVTEEDVAMAVRAALEAKRDEYASESADYNFYVHLPGGLWTTTFKNKVSDMANALARAHCKTWADKYKWPRQKGFTFSLYGEAESVQFAQEWVDKAHFFYEIWKSNADGSYAYQYSDEDFASYVPMQAWIDFACAQDITDDIMWPTVQDIMTFLPTNPVL
jgi:hypothetical protein